MKYCAVLIGYIMALSTTSLCAASNSAAEITNVKLGAATFQDRCVLCHGPEGKGNGRMAKLLTPKPSDLTQSNLSKQEMQQIVTYGGASVNRSEAMPIWNDALTFNEISSVILYIKTLNKN